VKGTEIDIEKEKKQKQRIFNIKDYSTEKLKLEILT